MTLSRRSVSRRDVLRGISLAASATALPMLGARRATAQSGESITVRQVENADRKLLFVVCAMGGASIIDSFLPVPESQVGDFFAAQALNVYPDAMLEQPAGSAFRVPKLLDDYSIYGRPELSLSDFVKKHGSDAVVVAHEVSSVNHTVGQQRSLNGAGINRGRTLMEATALRYGGGLPIPNINMASDGYLRHGNDSSIPFEARHELIAEPALFGAGTHGYQGLGVAVTPALMDRARAVRKRLDNESVYGRTFAPDARRKAYLRTRDEIVPRIEAAGLLEKLLLLDTSRADPKYGLVSSQLTQSVRSVLPNIEVDRMEAQLALAFLATHHGVSTSAVVGFSNDPYITEAGVVHGAPIAFDFSHSAHRVVQSLMWGRTVSTLDKLITLLKTHNYLGDPNLGKMWDRSLIYVATEFGRDKVRPAFAASWGTGHNLNNGSLLLSPMLKGNAVYGGVDAKTCLTYGCDLDTGLPTPGSQLDESHVYGLIAAALDLDAPAAPMLRAAVRG